MNVRNIEKYEAVKSNRLVQYYKKWYKQQPDEHLDQFKNFESLS